MRTDGVRRPESTGTGLLVFKVAWPTGTAYFGKPMKQPINSASLFSHTYKWYSVWYGHHIWHNMHQPGKVANFARGQLNRETEYFPVPVRAWKFRLARRVRPSRPARACSFSTLRLNLVLTLGFLPVSVTASIYLYRHTSSGQSRVYRVTQLRTDGVHCRESTGTGPVVLKAVPVMGAAFAGHHGSSNVRLYLPTSTIANICDTHSIGDIMQYSFTTAWLERHETKCNPSARVTKGKQNYPKIDSDLALERGENTGTERSTIILCRDISKLKSPRRYTGRS